MDRQFERTIQILEDVVRAYVMDFGVSWDQFLPLVEFAYYNSYQSSIQMAPYEAPYGRQCRSPVGFAHEDVMRFGKKGKLIPRYIGHFEIHERVGEVAYKLALPPSLSAVHPVFHVFMLWKYHSDLSYVLYFRSVQLDKDSSYVEEPMVVLDKQVRKLRSKNIASVKVQWRGQLIEEAGLQSNVYENRKSILLELNQLWRNQLGFESLNSDSSYCNWFGVECRNGSVTTHKH
ncbi:uncharacterized protein [Nicotiana sylvestris]|uniref:uncharacterized protein n=1 Tax=Nicotiana sylvestris TaxID=4096 RepID=UPI00388CA004